jgi:mannose/cellobiose epimerase-like protein (N-acyl-D-glucosamine 2-epimerase family)
MTDFRPLCAELADTLECVLDSPDPHCLALIARARAALAQPESVEPTRKEAVDLYSEVMAAHDCQTLGEMAEHFARAVLARWGQP